MVIDALCQRWSQPPDVIQRQSAYDVFQTVGLVAMAQAEQAGPEIRLSDEEREEQLLFG